jgi:hypothetical protein
VDSNFSFSIPQGEKVGGVDPNLHQMGPTHQMTDYDNNQLRNLVLLPKEMQVEINKSDDEDVKNVSGAKNQSASASANISRNLNGSSSNNN